MKSLTLLCALLALAPFGLRAATISEGDVVVAPLSGEVSDAQAIFLRRALKEAETAGAAAFVIDMDTPGGGLQSAVDIVQMLLKAGIPTYTWVNDDAGSAGALIALGSDHVYMASVSAIGAAAPVISGGEDIPGTMNDKVKSYFSGYFRSAAEAKGRNPQLAEAFIDKEKEFKIGDVVISPAGSLLTLSPKEATRVFDGKPLLADGIADSIDQLKQEAGLAGATVEFQPSGFETLALWITMMAPVFMLGGIVAAYMEFKTPGFGVAGILSLTCFAIFFLGHYVAGLTGLESMAVFLLGVVLIIVELVFFPGVFAVAALGVALMVGSLFFAMVDTFPGDPWLPDPALLVRPAINLTIAVAASILAISLLARYFPHLPFFGRLILNTSDSAPPLPQSANAGQLSAGAVGTTRSILRPAGTAEFDGRPVDVITDGEFIEAGAKVRVVTAGFSRVVVARAD